MSEIRPDEIQRSRNPDYRTQDAMDARKREADKRIRELRRLKADLMNSPRAGMKLRRLPSELAADLPEDLALWPTWDS